MFICKFCDSERKSKKSLSAHQRLCPKNSNRVYVSHTKGITAWNKGLSSLTDERIAKIGRSLSKSMKENPRLLTQEQKDHLSTVAKARSFGGYRENAGRSKKFRVIDSFGKETVLQSTYELQCSQLLNDMGIKWLRPRALKYDGKNYFADFYLPDYDIYLDPKNNYKARVDAEKIRKVVEQNEVKLFVLLKNQIVEDYIASLVK